jgi:general secretion pathway protein B
MSFILDALKKSESDRQRQTGPALFEVKLAPPKARFPLWAIAIAVLLGVNMIVVCWLLLRHSSRTEESANVAATPNTVVNTAAIPAQVANAAAPTNGPALTQGATPQAPPAQPPSPPTGNPVAATSPTVPARGAIGSSQEPTLAGALKDAAALNDEAPLAGTNPDDYAPATDPGPATPFKGHVKRGTESGLMLYQDAALVTGSNLPQLRLDLHVYAASPHERFALINMHKLHEGDSLLPEGVRVESITTDGVIVSHNGSRFLLPRD